MTYYTEADLRASLSHSSTTYSAREALRKQATRTGRDCCTNG